jgi:O-antigen/teichoic acid export membrane protein
MIEQTKNTNKNLASGRLMARNTIFNLIGQGAPVLVAFFAIPLLIKGLGTDRFGVLTIAWMIIGYFSLFDLGLGRALTQLVAQKLGTGSDEEIPELVWTSMSLMLILGFIGALVVYLLSPWLVQYALKIPPTLQGETLSSFYLLAFSIPIVISTVALRGVLEAYQRFDLINVIRTIMGIFTFVGPLLVLPFSESLFPIVAVLLFSRGIALIAHLQFCLNAVPAIRNFSLSKDVIIPLLGFGGWMTVTNIVGPLMVYLDRFLIGSILSMAAVAYYATPYEVVTKLWIFPGAFVGVLFPAFAASFIEDRNRTARLFGRGVKYVFLALFPLLLVIVTLAHEGLDWWVGPQFVQNSTRVLQWLAVGVFINSLAQVPLALIQGMGRPDLTAKLHLIELPFYLPLLLLLLNVYGITGAAIAWTFRVAIDTAVLFFMTKRLMPEVTPVIKKGVPTALMGLTILALSGYMTGQVMGWLFLILALPVFAFIAWYLILEPEERWTIRQLLKAVPILN